MPKDQSDLTESTPTQFTDEMQLLWNESLAGGKSSLVFGQGEEKMLGEILEQELKQIRDKKKTVARQKETQASPVEAHVALIPRMSSDSGQLMTGIHRRSESKSAGAALETKVALLISFQQAAWSASPSPPASVGCCLQPHPSIYQRDQCWRFREHPKLERSQRSSEAPRGVATMGARSRIICVCNGARGQNAASQSQLCAPESHITS